MLTQKQREDMRERLTKDFVDTLITWARTDYDSLHSFVADSGRYHDMNDEDLMQIYEAEFDVIIDPDTGEEQEE